MHTRCIFLTVLLVSVVLGLTCHVVSAQPPALELTDVRVEPQIFNPSDGENADIFYYLSAPASVTIQAFDGDHYRIAEVQTDRPAFAGTNHARWSGRDDTGAIVPDDAYYFVIRAVDALGQSVTYDPCLLSGGATVRMDLPQLDKEAGMVRYTVSQPARVRLRAGVHEGPLLKTLLDWTPVTAGTHEIAWDGREGGEGQPLWEHERFTFSAAAYSLPENSVITQGNTVTVMQYWSKAAEKEGMGLIPYRLSTEQGMKAYEKTKTVLSTALQERSKAIDTNYASSPFMSRAPEFHLACKEGAEKAGDGTPIATGVFPIEVNISDASKALLGEQRYEYVLYVDNVLVREVETGYTPYTWDLDTKTLASGRHIVTVNVAAMNGPVGASSLWIEVANPAESTE